MKKDNIKLIIGSQEKNSNQNQDSNLGPPKAQIMRFGFN